VDLAPDSHTVKHAAGVYTRMLSSSRGDYAMYVDGDGSAELTLTLPAGEYTVTWVSVVDGGKTGEVFLHEGGDKVVKTPEVRSGVAMRMSRAVGP